MAVAKRQEREKHAKIEQRKVQELELEPQVEQTALLASPIYIRQAQVEGKKQTNKHIKRGAKVLSLSLSPMCWSALLFESVGRHAFTPQRWIFLLFYK